MAAIITQCYIISSFYLFFSYRPVGRPSDAYPEPLRPPVVCDLPLATLLGQGGHVYTSTPLVCCIVLYRLILYYMLAFHIIVYII